jgi:hypothetical protein
MSKKGEVKEFNEIQKTAVKLLNEKVVEKRKQYISAAGLWKNLLFEIGKEMKLPQSELNDWHLKQDMSGFEFNPKEPKKPIPKIPKGKKK